MRAADSGSWERVRQLAAQGDPAPSCGGGPGPARAPGPAPCERCADALGPAYRPRAGAPPTPEDSGSGQPVLLREEVSRLQEEVHLLRQMKEMLAKDLEESQGGKASEVLSATELRVQLAQKEQELARAKEALQAMLHSRRIPGSFPSISASQPLFPSQPGAQSWDFPERDAASPGCIAEVSGLPVEFGLVQEVAKHCLNLLFQNLFQGQNCLPCT